MRSILYRIYRKARILFEREINRRRDLESVFTSIYENNRWGGERGGFYSGSGSTAYYANAYAEMVRGFIREQGVSTVVDLGCGDFAVGSLIVSNDIDYVGVDIVADLINRNRERFNSQHITFQHLDIVSSPLPGGELCLIRQVLQHLSNAEIAAVLRKIDKYKYVIISEHLPAPSVHVVPNKDKPHGPDVRVYDASGVYIDKPPFNVPVSRLLLEVQCVGFLVSKGETIRSQLVENHEAHIETADRS